MARLLNGTSDFIERASGVSLAPPLTICAWFNTSSLAAQSQIAAVNVGLEADYCLLVRTTGNIRARQAETSGLADSSSSGSTITTNTWHHAAGVFTSNVSRLVYLDGTAGSSSTNAVTNSTATRITVGTRYSAGTKIEWFPGIIAEVGVWNAALSASDIASLAKGFSPSLIRPQNLIDYIPLTGRNSPETGSKGGAYTLTGTSQSSHPRIFL